LSTQRQDPERHKEDRRNHLFRQVEASSAEVADEIRIRWPSGALTRLPAVSADRYLVVVEGVEGYFLMTPVVSKTTSPGSSRSRISMVSPMSICIRSWATVSGPS